MPYVRPFDMIKHAANISTIKGEVRLTFSYDEFIGVVKQLLSSIPVDEEWYVQRYDDIAKAIRAGEIKSAHAHFVEHGYIEGRQPSPIVVDEGWYLEQYPDVAESVRNGTEISAQTHFDRNGYREGRLPFPP